jgi:hypothetical protein
VKALLLWFLGTVVAPVILDQCTEVFPWLAERLVRRAARRIPQAERPRGEEEWLEELASKPGGLVKLLWALWSLPLLRGSGEMGRLLGSPPISEVIRARLRTVWHKLPFRAKASPQDQVTGPGPEPAAVQIELSDVAAAVDTLTVKTMWRTGSDTHLVVRPSSGRRAGMLHLSDEEFIEWLAQQRKEFEDDLDRRVKEYRNNPDRPLPG